ncbi:MAG: hypothetical protein QXL52_04230 [Nitrososphaerales archaeon]
MLTGDNATKIHGMIVAIRAMIRVLGILCSRFLELSPIFVRSSKSEGEEVKTDPEQPL